LYLNSLTKTKNLPEKYEEKLNSAARIANHHNCDWRLQKWCTIITENGT